MGEFRGRAGNPAPDRVHDRVDGGVLDVRAAAHAGTGVFGVLDKSHGLAEGDAVERNARGAAVGGDGPDGREGRWPVPGERPGPSVGLASGGTACGGQSGQMEALAAEGDLRVDHRVRLRLEPGKVT